nr:MAG TPA: hypothetical protein [Caudoviricetes sp.]
MESWISICSFDMRKSSCKLGNISYCGIKRYPNFVLPN